jgi:Mg-chelatase subunit ChlD
VPSVPGNAAGTDATGSNDTGGGSSAGDGSGAGTGTGNGQGSDTGPFGVGAGSGTGTRHIVYLLDISLSMPTRIERAKDELRNALATLAPGESFDIVAFCARRHTFDSELVEATPKTIADGNEFLDSLSLDEGTDLQSALYQALDVPGVNTVVVITDGVPTVGETNFGKIARHARQHNRQHAKIFTIGLVGKNPDGSDDSFEASWLLRQLAKESGGQCKLVELGAATPD